MVGTARNMIIQYAPLFIEKLKRVNVRIRKSFMQKIQIFENNPNDPQLRNHELEKDYKGQRSIDITADYRAIFEEIKEGEDTIIYFSLLGTHKDLYG